ncbi:type IV secretion system protein VirD4 [Lachnospiraceae bacterium PM6-15]|uniref:VirD4-like conjugal transfer protein, CD1115 family n=1 Tax=Ohessyouella blattaphilus TaxID=2949333 RepID=UPI003E1E9C2C
MQEKKKPQYGLWAVLFVLACLAGYYMAGLYKAPGVTLENVADKLANIILTPATNYYNAYTGRCIALMLTIWLVGLTTYLTNLRNYMFGKEYGSAQWESITRFNRMLADYKGRKKAKNLTNNNRILTESARINYDSSKTQLNNNQLIVGGSGAGKTAFFISPNLLQFHGSNVYTDPKGGILDDFGNLLEEKGVVVKALNLLSGEMHKSAQYNPFNYIRKFSDIQKLITNLLANTTPAEATKGDPFWDKAETLYLMAIFTYVWMECHGQNEPIYKLNNRKNDRVPTGKEHVLGKNFRTVLYLLDEAEVSDDEDSKSLLTLRMEELAENHPLGDKHPAVRSYYKCIRGAGDTVRSIIISANSRFAPFDNEELLRILDDDDLNLGDIGVGVHGDGETKTALFCVIPDDDDTFNFVVGMLYTQLFQELYRLARLYPGNKLPLDVGFWFDEFANIKMPASFDKILATCRSRGIYCAIVLQSLAQLKAIYKDKWEGLMGNCDTFVYLGGNEQSSHKYVSETLGKWTIDKRSTGESLGKNGSNSRNYDVLGRELLTPDEVSNLDNRKMIVRVRGYNPIFDNKWFLFKKPIYKYAKSLGKYEVVNNIEKDAITGRLQTKKIVGGVTSLSDESAMYYKKREEDGDNVKCYELDFLDFMKIDFDDTASEELEQTLEDLTEAIEQQEADYQSELMVEEALNKGKVYEDSYTEDMKKLSVMEIVLKYDFDEDQQREIQKGIQNGLTEKEIKQFLDISYSSAKMGIIRELLEKAHA